MITSGVLPPALFKGAADSLQSANPGTDAQAEALLGALGYLNAGSRGNGHVESPEIRSNRASLLNLAAQFETIFQIHAPDAPGLAFIGAELVPAWGHKRGPNATKVGLSGKGVSIRTAFESCVGEGAEFLSQLQTEQDQIVVLSIGEALSSLDPRSRSEMTRFFGLGTDFAKEIDCVKVARLSDCVPAYLPADLVLRRPPSGRRLEFPLRLGAGTAAGRSVEEATAHALLELVERDAVGLWWKGGRRGRALDPRPLGADQFLRMLRGGREDRRTWLLDITTNINVPCVVALSCEPGGAKFAFGASARFSMAEAAKGALLETCQIELANAIVAAKMEQSGESALNEFDKRHLLRTNSISGETCALLHPSPDPVDRESEPLALATMSDLIERLASLGNEAYGCEITRQEYNIPTMRVVAPSLQLEPSELTSERLVVATARFDRRP